MKTTISATLAALAAVTFASSLFVAGCSQSMDDASSSNGSALSAALSSPVLHAEPNAVAADYHLQTQTLRLFGTQTSADGGGYATIADKSTWMTKSYAVGDWLSRNYQVASITADAVTLRGAAGLTTLKAGQETTIAALYHRFDTAGTYLGQNAWQIDGKTFADIHATYGAGATAVERSGTGPANTAIGTVTTVVLTSVDANGVLARAGLHKGSVLVSMNGTQLHATDLDALASALTKSGTTVSLVVSSHGAQGTVTYTVS